jgi:DNA-binding XRE family transcriptional regulator
VTNDQADFADKTGISRAGVNHIVKGAQESTFGWAVEVFSHLPKVLTLSDKTIVSLENIYETTYIATRLSDGFSEEFTVQRPFAKKYNLSYKSINKCLHGGAKSHKGWTFKIKEEENKEEK